ncbi:hypothetical protein NDU88_003892 [Pleurodeles waltl]|uniref:Uncharacterized protein n=1 Tax=Pleurodeles waltl TaxID=8319 RepID=A0AAV7SH96_PLEWA|nr:hypothetical protein NDU88_003892 [Pleurodeles waltl]
MSSVRFRIEETLRLPGEVENKQRSCRITSESGTKQQVSPTRVVESEECFVLQMVVKRACYAFLHQHWRVLNPHVKSCKGNNSRRSSLPYDQHSVRFPPDAH